jgi:hypothetical protein
LALSRENQNKSTKSIAVTFLTDHLSERGHAALAQARRCKRITNGSL